MINRAAGEPSGAFCHHVVTKRAGSIAFDTFCDFGNRDYSYYAANAETSVSHTFRSETTKRARFGEEERKTERERERERERG